MHNELVKSSMPNIPISINQSALMDNKLPMQICYTHIHDDIEILYILSGELSCVVGDKDNLGKKGDIIYVGSRVPHYTKSMDFGTKYMLIQFSASNFSETSGSISKYLYRFINSGEAPIIIYKSGTPECSEFTGYVNNIAREFEKKEPAYETYIKADIYNILAFLYRHGALLDADSFFDSNNIEKVLPSLKYIDENYQEEITLDFLSKLLNLNPYYFCRLFKKATNSTFTEYLNFVRVCKSEKQLYSSTKTISEISMEVGFSSVSYFNRVFRKFKNCTPTEYRKIKYSRQ
ncbi:MAG: AraC family transcriptional regulator [Bacillota bacterium]|nr:AraC family transcriptional regulator [Bacillota bacterium]